MTVIEIDPTDLRVGDVIVAYKRGRDGWFTYYEPAPVTFIRHRGNDGRWGHGGNYVTNTWSGKLQIKRRNVLRAHALGDLQLDGLHVQSRHSHAAALWCAVRADAGSLALVPRGTEVPSDVTAILI